MHGHTSLEPLNLIAAGFHFPLFSLVVASLLLPIVLVSMRLREDHQSRAPMGGAATVRAVATRYRPERVVVRIGAAVVIAVFVAENVVRGYLLNLADVVEWWEYATPVFTASLCLGVLLALIVLRGSAPPERPVLPVTRRTWTTFTTRVGLVGSSVTLAALLVTTILAGLASSAEADGRFIYLEVPVANQPIDPLRPWFYGWSYGVPVLICLAVLVLIAWATLRANAVRPFRRPKTVAAEQAARAGIASGVLSIATAGMLLALAGAWRLIARAGSLGQLTIDGPHSGTYETTWRYAEFAAWAGAVAPILEVAAFLLLLLVAIRPQNGFSRHLLAVEPDRVPEIESAR